jgi:hypothetical protein
MIRGRIYIEDLDVCVSRVSQPSRHAMSVASRSDENNSLYRF